MHQLASISFVNSSGKPERVQAGRILRVLHRQDGSDLLLDDGTRIETQTTVADITTAQDVVWNAYLTALTGV